MASAARRVAHKVLIRVFDEGAYADRAFAGETAELDARDRAFAQRLAYGVTQRVRTLDHAIEAIGRRVAADRVRPGGSITYSVCTIAKAENEDVVDESGLQTDPLGEESPEFVHPRRPEFLLTLPHRHRTSGFFVARIGA